MKTRLLAALLGTVSLVACSESPSEPEPTERADRGPQRSSIFHDATAETGLDFVHFNGMTGQLYFAETMGAGGALFDFDNDGDLDLYLVQGALLEPNARIADATFPPEPGKPLSDRLFRNDLDRAPDGSSTVHFTDVTEASGLSSVDYGMGIAAGDYDNDGWVDLYVTNFGPNRLLKNQGDGSFRDVAQEVGAGDPRWSVPAVFFDYDRDGDLDLYVGNYVDFSVATHSVCFSDLGERNYCGPLSYRPLPDRLLRNRGDGTFEDATSASGLAGSGAAPRAGLGGALGAISADFDGNGWLDLYVGNDGLPNQLWRNRGDGTFIDTALLAGAAVNADGNAEATMGIVVADHDQDGDEDLFLTHLNGESNTLYSNLGGGMFDQVPAAGGLSAPSLPFTGFGTVWRDLDQDGYLDVVVLNGAVSVLPDLLLAGDSHPLHQRNQLFLGRPGGTYALAEPASAGPFLRSEVSRAAIAGDLDNDGDLDLVVTNNSGPARLWINDTSTVQPRRQWIGLRLVLPLGSAEPAGDSASGTGFREALGTRVEVVFEDGRVLVDRVRSEGGYAAANDPRLLFAIGGPGGKMAAVHVDWLDGTRETWTDLRLGRYTTLVQGSSASSP